MKTEKEMLSELEALCSRAEHCTFELREKMGRYEVDEEVQERIINRLVKNQYVDDERYARCFAAEKVKYNRWGRRKVEQALRMKRIPVEVITSVLGEIDDETYLEVLRPLLNSKAKGIKAANGYERNRKLLQFAMGRGFDYELIRECVKEIGGETDMECEDDIRYESGFGCEAEE
ncbi:MAG: regulatory protein RecX [Prevotella sp.]